MTDCATVMNKKVDTIFFISLFQTGLCFFIFPLIPFIIRFYGDEDQDDANENKAYVLPDSNGNGQDEENGGFELQEYVPKETSVLASMCMFIHFKQTRLRK